jgi:UDPglucose 6-dehydrogenase
LSLDPARGGPSPPPTGVIGLGYMGLATAAAFARHGVPTFGYDVVPERRTTVRAGHAPFHEDGLEALIRSEVRRGRLTIVESLDEIARRASVLFLCLPTPPRADGRIDLRPIRSGARQLGRALAKVNGFRLVVVKSTVVPGTTETVVGPELRRAAGKGPESIGVAASPEFLAEGRMVQDALHPDRIVVGTTDPRATRLVESLYSTFDSPLILMTPSAAEMTKYAANTFLAMKISFVNELSRFSEHAGVDVDDVVRGLGSDPRVGARFLEAGPGFGGSCFSKDVQAFVRSARDHGVRLRLAGQVMLVNEEQTRHAADLILDALPGTAPRGTATILGLAFKEGTDDLRESRALPIVEQLATPGVTVRVHDPVASVKFRAWLTDQKPSVRGRVTVASSVEEALDGTDVAALQVPWPEYLAWTRSWSRRMRHPVLVDLRRAFPVERARTAGLQLIRLGDGRRPAEPEGAPRPRAPSSARPMAAEVARPASVGPEVVG